MKPCYSLAHSVLIVSKCNKQINLEKISVKVSIQVKFVCTLLQRWCFLLKVSVWMWRDVGLGSRPVDNCNCCCWGRWCSTDWCRVCVNTGTTWWQPSSSCSAVSTHVSVCLSKCLSPVTLCVSSRRLSLIYLHHSRSCCWFCMRIRSFIVSDNNTLRGGKEQTDDCIDQCQLLWTMLLMLSFYDWH